MRCVTMKESDEGWIPPLSAPSPTIAGPTQMGGVDGDAHYLYAFYDRPTDVLENEVPAPLSIAPESESPRVRVVLGDGYQPPHTTEFHEGVLSLKVTYDKYTGWYSAYIWTSNDQAMDGGRVYGINKQLCEDTPLSWEGDEISGMLRRYGDDLWRMTFAYSSPPPELREVDLEAQLVDIMGGDDVGVIGFKKVPSPDPEGKVLKQVIYTQLEEVSTQEIWAGNAALEFHPHAKYPRMHKLEPAQQPEDIEAAFYVRPQWMLADGEVVWERFE